MRTLPYSVPATTTSLGFSLPHVTRTSATAPFPLTTALSTTIPSAAVCEPKNKNKHIRQGKDTERSTTHEQGGQVDDYDNDYACDDDVLTKLRVAEIVRIG